MSEVLLGKGEGLFPEIRVYEGNYENTTFRTYQLEPKSTVDNIVEIFLMNKNIVPTMEVLKEYCLVEIDLEYEIERTLSGSMRPLPSMQNLERYEGGRFLLRRNSLVAGLIHQREVESQILEAKTVDDGQRLIDALLARVVVDFEVPDFRRTSQEDDQQLKAAHFYPDFLVVAEKLIRASLLQRHADLRNTKFDSESRKEKQVLRRKVTAKLSNFFGVSKREAEVAAIRNKIQPVVNLEELPASSPLGGNEEEEEHEQEEVPDQRRGSTTRERQRALKLAGFFGVNQSEIEIRELRKLLENIETDDVRDSSDLEQFDYKKSKGTSIRIFLKRSVIPDMPVTFQVRSSIDLEDVGKRLKASIHLKPYRFRFATYQNCFAGRDAVDWLCVNSTESGSIGRLEAVALGNLLLQKGLFIHIQKKHDFQDKMFYYQFTGMTSEPAVVATVPDEQTSLLDITNVIRKEGWIQRFDVKRKEWRRFYCSVENMTLDIRIEPPIRLQNAKPEVLPFKTLNLEGCVIGLGDPKKFAFEVKKPNGKIAIFATESSEQCAQWVNALKIASRIHPLDKTTEGFKVSLDDFEFLKVIGKGTSGKVLLCVEKKSGNVYAMKILKKSDITGPKHLKGARVEHRVLREIRHPFIVELHYAFQSEDRLYFVMDYLSGGELFQHICEHGPFTENRARFYAAEIFLALQHLHQNGIIYRDLKLENIMMDRDGHLKVTDFGMCKDELKAGMKTNSICGTSEYLPPEIILRTRYGPSVDWWTFGIVLFEMLFGEHPFYSEDKETLYTNILYKEIEFPPNCSPEAKSLLQGLLERDPEDRLGCNEHRDGEDIRNHPFFAPIDFEKLLRKEIAPSFVPKIASMTDVSYFDPAFTNEPMIMTPTDRSSVFDNQFDGFSFVAERTLQP